MLSGFFVAKLVLANNVLELEVARNQVSGGHQVVVVHVLHESLDLGSSLDFLLAHSLGDSQRVSLNASDQSVSELLVLQNGSEIKGAVSYLLSIVVLSHNDSFLSGMSSSKKNDNSSRFHTKDKRLLIRLKESGIASRTQNPVAPLATHLSGRGSEEGQWSGVTLQKERSSLHFPHCSELLIYNPNK